MTENGIGRIRVLALMEIANENYDDDDRKPHLRVIIDRMKETANKALSIKSESTDSVGERNQDELWKELSKEIDSDEAGFWLYEDWDGFKLTEKGINYLKEKFIITRRIST